MPIGFSGAYLFGPDIKKDIFLNIEVIEPNFITYFLRISFLIVLAAHIPFIFYAGKECTLAMVNEFSSRTIS